MTVFIAVLSYRLKRAEQWRIKNVEKRGSLEPLDASTPLKNQEKMALRRAAESIHDRFTNIRRILVLTTIVIGGPLLLLPFLEGSTSVSISLLIGIATAVIGIAVRPVVENTISGLVLSFSYPARIGDTVMIDGHYGTIERIGITQSIIKIWDWRRYVIPNSKFLNKEFINLSYIDKFEWACVEFWVSHESDIEQVERLAVETMRQAPGFFNHEDPRFWVMELGRDAIKCWICGWALNPADAWELKAYVRKRLISTFREAGVQSHQFRNHLDIPNTRIISNHLSS